MGLFKTVLLRIMRANDRFTKTALTLSIFELEECSFFKWAKILPEIDWRYSGTCVHSPESNIDKGPYEQSVRSEPSVGCVGGVNFFIYLWGYVSENYPDLGIFPQVWWGVGYIIL